MVLEGKSLQEYLANAGVPPGSILGRTLFLKLMTFLIMQSVILLSMLMIQLPTLIVIVIRHLICDINYNWLLNLNLINETLWTGSGSDL